MATSTTTPPQTPLKLKQFQSDPKTPTSTTPLENKAKPGSIDKPCKYFVSDAGCRAGKGCKWVHSWEGVADKASRCWICGSKEHRKQDCMVKSGKKPGEPSVGPGGGRGNPGNAPSTSTTSSSSTSMGGKAGAAAVKVAKNAEEASTKTEGSTTSPETTSSTTSGVKDGNGGAV